jgi:hypothetical protein
MMSLQAAEAAAAAAAGGGGRGPGAGGKQGGVGGGLYRATAPPDPLCMSNASLHALQNLQPWADDEYDMSAVDYALEVGVGGVPHGLSGLVGGGSGSGRLTPTTRCTPVSGIQRPSSSCTSSEDESGNGNGSCRSRGVLSSSPPPLSMSASASAGNGLETTSAVVHHPRPTYRSPLAIGVRVQMDT